LDGEVKSGLSGFKNTLADRTLFIDLYRLVEKLGVEVFDLLHSHVVLFDQCHDLFTSDIAALLADLKQVLDVHYGPDVNGGDITFSLHFGSLSYVKVQGFPLNIIVQRKPQYYTLRSTLRQ
jgi:hypothetical protein